MNETTALGVNELCMFHPLRAANAGEGGLRLSFAGGADLRRLAPGMGGE